MSLIHFKPALSFKTVLPLLFFIPGICLIHSHAPASPEPKKLHFKLSAKDLPTDGMWKSTPVFADFNKDGHLDFAAHPRLGNGAKVWLGDGQGSWKESSQGLHMDNSCGGGLAVADVNGTGHLDLVVADHCHGVFVYFNDGKANWTPVVQGLAPQPPPSTREPVPPDAPEADDGEHDEDTGMFVGAESVALGDLNGDGHLDMVTGGSDRGGYTVYFGDGTGKNWAEQQGHGLYTVQNPDPLSFHGAGWVNHILLRDMNKDGHLDVVATYYQGPRVYLGDGKGKFTPANEGLSTPSIAGLYRAIDVGDVNGDGLMDLVIANYVNGIELYLQQPDGTWKGPIDVFPEMRGGARGVALGDMDNDGHLDVVACGAMKADYGNIFGIFTAKGDGKGGWTPFADTGLPTEGLSVAWGVALADVNRNGLLDLAVTTGGVVGMPDPVMAQRLGDKITVIPELEIPRVQIWLNAMEPPRQ